MAEVLEFCIFIEGYIAHFVTSKKEVGAKKVNKKRLGRNLSLEADWVRGGLEGAGSLSPSPDPDAEEDDVDLVRGERPLVFFTR